MSQGTVYLVGAGPGDPGLLTCRGHQLLIDCDCVVHDYLVDPLIVALAPASATVHDVGKRGGTTSIRQEAINQLLIDLAGRHRRVVRLKGGDPFLFGRGGEEAAALAAAGIAFEVVPGVTSGTGVPAYAGIPITHRAASSAVAFVTGHRQAGEPGAIDWATFASIETLVLYMGMHRLADNCAALIAHGRAPSTPACAIQWGTTPRQRVVVGTLATLPELVAQAKLGAPAITVIGDVVRYRQRIRWYDDPQRRPLFGTRILVTRSRDQIGSLAQSLRQLGAEVVERPLARFVANPDSAELDRQLLALDGFAWVAFTSANGVRFVWERILALGKDARLFGRCAIAALGSATAEALTQHGLRADLQPTSAQAHDLARALGSHRPARILLPQADNARSILRETLVAQGWDTTSVVAYRALTLPVILADHGHLDAITFASSGTVERFLDACPMTERERLAHAGCRFYAIGPQTAQTMQRHGLAVAGMAAESSVEGLVACIVADLPGSLRPPLP